MQLIKSIFLSAFALISFNTYAIDQMYNWNGLEFVTSGNVTHVHPASPQSTVLRGGWTLDISDVEPKATATHPVPYKNQSNALVTVKPQIDPSKVGAKAAQALKAGAKGFGYVGLASIACDLTDCASAASALLGWGVEKLDLNTDGTISALVPDPNADLSYSDGHTYHLNGVSALSLGTFCTAYISYANSRITGGWYYTFHSLTPEINSCRVNQHRPNGDVYSVTGWTANRSGGSSCLVGQPIVNGVCNGSATVEQPLTDYFSGRYTGKGWDHHWAKMTAEIVKNGGNVFTDGTSTDITGPAIVPISTSETKTSVSLVPGTTTPAPVGHIGPTDSGTQTTTTTTTAHNKYNPAPLTSGTSGSPASGPSMETTQKTTTTTSITNNVTNITNIVNETTTEKDEAPEEAPTDTPFADLPELYKQKYPDGLIGVLRTQTAAMKATPLFQLPMQLMGDLPQTGQCPSWQLDLSLASWASFGTYNVGADCSIWDFAGWVIVISAFILARQLIFGG